MPIPPILSSLDANQVLKAAFDDNTHTLRTSTTAIIAPTGSVNIIIASSADSVAIGSADGSSTATLTTVTGKTGIDVNVINFPPVQAVSGDALTATIANSLAISSIVPVGISGTTAVSGSALTATVANSLAVSSIVPVGISGTTAVSGSALTATVANSLAVSSIVPVAVSGTTAVSGTVFVKASTGTFTDYSAKASTTSTQFVPANPNRKYLMIYNNSSSINVWINFTNAAVQNGAGSFRLGTNSMFVMEGTWVTTESVNIVSGSGTPTITVKEGT